MKRACFAGVMAVLVSLVVGIPAFAQDDTVDMAFGVVEEVSAQSITLSVYNDMTDAEELITYQIASDVQLEGAAMVTDIQVGSTVEIEYAGSEASKSAKVIYILDEPGSDDMMEDESTDDEMSEAEEETPEAQQAE